MVPLIWREWVALLLALAIAAGIARFATEMIPVLAICGLPAILLHFDTSPRRPIWAFRKDRA